MRHLDRTGCYYGVFIIAGIAFVAVGKITGWW